MAEYLELSQANTLFSDVDARFDTTEGKIPSNASSGNKMVTASDIATKADLVDGKVPAAQLPSFVDDVLEYASTSAFPATGESGKIYVALDTNKTYRWGGSDYVEISESLALGETSSTAYAGDKGKANADAISDIQDVIPSGASTSNKLATASDIPDTSGLQPKTLSTTIGSYTTVEGALSGINDGKVDKVTGKGLSTNDYDATAKGIVDSIPLTVSQLQGSLLEKFPRSEQRVLGAKQLIPYPYTDTTKTNHGITFTDNGDGTITLSGTNDGVEASSFTLVNQNNTAARSKFLEYKDMILSGAVSSDIYLGFWNAKGDSTNQQEKGSGIDIDFENQSSSFNIIIGVGLNVSISTPITVDPLLRLATDPDDTYVPYAMTNRELTEMMTVQESAVTTELSVDSLIGNHLYKYGKVVHLCLGLQGVTASSGDAIATIPSGYRPKQIAIYVAGATGGTRRITIQSNGTISMSDAISGANLQIALTWITS